MRWWNSKLFVLGGLILATGCMDDPFDFGGPRSCEVADQNEWVYGVMQHVYLWREELPELDPTTFESPADLVRELRFDVDRWSRVSDKRQTEALFQEGKTISLGFGTRRDADSRVVVSLVHERSPAGAAGMRRGDIIEGVGGFTTEELDDQGLWSGIYGENVPGVEVDLVVSSPDGVRDIHLVKDWVDIITVPQVDVLEVDGQHLGYVVFSSFLEPALVELNDAFGQLVEADVRNLVLDMRYNGGGLVRVARHLLNLLAGNEADGEVAYRVEYGSGLADQNESRSISAAGNSIQNLETVTFITTGSSVSATELVINALRPYVDVRVVGSTTGGKPVGSRHFSFCDKVLAPITFQIVNAEGYGDYFTGIEPDCSARDGLSHQLGDPAESAFAEAVHLLKTGSCSPPSEDDDDDGLPRRQDVQLHPEAGDLLIGYF
jgi:carboxyl-terminal processing protease